MTYLDVRCPNGDDCPDHQYLKNVVAFQDHGAAISVFAWIHRKDGGDDVEILDLGEFGKDWVNEFRRLMMEDNSG